MSTGRVAAVIVNYNAGNYLTDCISSLLDEGVVDIVVVDNGSSDGSLETATRRFPEIVIEHLPNPGYGAAMNHGVGLLDNEIVFLLNPDAKVKPGAVGILLDHLDANPGIAIVGPRIENEDGSLYPSARRFPSFLDGIGHAVFGMFFPENRWTRRYKMLDWGHGSCRDVDWVSGAAMFARHSAFESVGGFDDDYWLYMEDVDLCWRLRQDQWRIVFEPKAVVTHVQGTSTSKSATPFRFVVAHHKSVIRYHSKTARGLERLMLPLIAAGMVARLPLAWMRLRFPTRSRAIPS